VTGNFIPLIEYPDPLGVAEETVTSAFVADNVAVKVELLPTATFPKFSDAGETASVPVGLGLLALLGLLGFCVLEETPEQPVNASEAVSTNHPAATTNVDLNIVLQRNCVLKLRGCRERKGLCPFSTLGLHFCNGGTNEVCWQILSDLDVYCKWVLTNRMPAEEIQNV
jgi:hypothetical protein